MADTQYAPKPLIFKSVGVIARYAEDRLPQGAFLNLEGCLERQEDAMSSRYGSQVVNRDPTSGVGYGQNYFFSVAGQHDLAAKVQLRHVALRRSGNEPVSTQWRHAGAVHADSIRPVRNPVWHHLD